MKLGQFAPQAKSNENALSGCARFSHNSLNASRLQFWRHRTAFYIKQYPFFHIFNNHFFLEIQGHGGSAGAHLAMQYKKKKIVEPVMAVLSVCASTLPAQLHPDTQQPFLAHQHYLRVMTHSNRPETLSACVATNAAG